MTKEEWTNRLEAEGYKVLGAPTFGPGMELPEHTHGVATVHVILAGELTLTDKDGPKTHVQGDRFEIPAGMTHHGKCGPQGCTFLAAVRA